LVLLDSGETVGVKGFSPDKRWKVGAWGSQGRWERRDGT